MQLARDWAAVGAAVLARRRRRRRSSRARCRTRWRPPTPTTRRCWPRARSCARPTKACRRRWPAGGRPSCSSGTAGYGDGTYRTTSAARHQRRAATTATSSPAQATLTQPLYRGGATRASTNQADNRVFGQRARLIATEQQVFSDTVNAYVDRDPGAAGPAAQHQQRAGAGPAAAGHQRPLPGRRDHPHRRGPGRGGAGRRPRDAADRRGQPADRARQLPPLRRRAAGPADRAAAAEAAGQEPGGGGAARRRATTRT